MFNLDVFYIAVIDGEIAGIAACTDGKVSSVHLKSQELKTSGIFYENNNIFHIKARI